MKKIFLVVLLCCSCYSASVFAQLVRSFSPRFSLTTRGSVIQLANSSILSKSSAVDRSTMPPTCGSTSSTACKNDSYPGGNIDIDSDPTTYNSSSDTLTLPACSSVEFAGLYWGAGYQRLSTATAPVFGNWGTVKLRKPGSTVYENITALKTDTVSAIFYGYQSFADITSQVRSGGAGGYTVANVAIDSDKNNSYGGWAIVIVYRDSTLNVRNMTIFDGMAVVGTSGTGGITPVNFSVKGFICPPAGAVNCRMGVVVYDGDRDAIDGFDVRDTSGTFVDQTLSGQAAAATSGTTDAWNSSITVNGVVTTSRMPAYQNTYGFDAHQYILSNGGKRYLRNNDTGLSIRIRTASEGYVLGLLTTEIDTYKPEMLLENAVTDINGGSLAMGDTLLVQATVRNTGNDTALNVRLKSKLPSYLKYIPGSLTVNGVAQTDAVGDDLASYSVPAGSIDVNIGSGASAVNGGKIRATGTDIINLSYRLALSKVCSDIGVTPLTLTYQTSLSFFGFAATVSDSAASRPKSASSCIEPISPEPLYLSSGCNMVLPLDLLSFSGQRQDCRDVLSWTTANTGTLARFVLEQSSDGQSFAAVASVPYYPGQVSYAASALAMETAYYRLINEDRDGSRAYSSTLRLQGECSLPPVTLFPNPAAEQVRIDNLSGAYEVQLTDLMGRVLLRQSGQGPSLVLPLGGLPQGMYVVSITLPEYNRYSTHKLYHE